MSFLGSFACVKRVQELTNFFKLTLGLHIKTYSQYGELIFFCYLKKNTKKIYTDSCCVITEHVEWPGSSHRGASSPTSFCITGIHTLSTYYLIRMDKMFRKMPWFQFLVSIVLALQIIFAVFCCAVHYCMYKL